MAEQDYTGAGDKAAAAGLEIIDPTTHKVKYGGDEINITRDMIAELNPGLRQINAGVGAPDNSIGSDGDIYFGVF